MIQTRKSIVNSSVLQPAHHRWLPLFCALWLAFVLCQAPAAAANTALPYGPGAAPLANPVIITVEDTNRGLALESATFKPEPFAAVSGTASEKDRATRIVLFVTNLNILPGEDASYLSADAEDESHRIYQLAIERVEPIQFTNNYYLIIKLDKEMADVGDVLLRISKNGAASNRVRIGMGHIGGGPPDDPTSADSSSAIVITSISPASVLAGSAATNVFLTGSGFGATSVARFNGGARKTSFLNDSQLSVLLTASDLRFAGSFSIQAAHGGNAGKASNKVGLTVNNPAPSISGLSSSAVTAGAGNFALTVYGTNFVNKSAVTFHGSNRATKFVSANQLEAQILASDIQTAGQYRIGVVNPSPGGGQSNSLTFNVNGTAAPTPTPAPTATPTPTTQTTSGKQFYVSPQGSSSGAGSASNPWDLQTAFNHPSAVGPGDTVWIKGGTYRGVFVSKLTGTAAKPIHVRASPGERPVIDVNVPGLKNRQIQINGPYAWYWNLEVMDSDPKRVTGTAGSHPADLLRQQSSVTVNGEHVKLINPITHDLANGIRFWERAIDSEIYGAITFNNGWNGPDRGHGHGIYAQNATGTKNIREVISFNNFSTGMKLYGSEGQANSTNFDGIISFNNGSPAALLDNNPIWREHNLLVGSDHYPSKAIKITNSHFYYPGVTRTNNLHLGWYAPYNEDLTFTNNRVIGGQRVVFFRGWKSIVFTDNFLWLRPAALTGPKLIQMIHGGAGKQVSDHTFDRNAYYDTSGIGKAFQPVGSYLTFAEWQNLGADANSTYTPRAPTVQQVFVRPNIYEQGRAHIVVYNWTGSNHALVDLSGAGLVAGDNYEIRDAQDFFGAPVLSGKYSGASVQVPLAARAVVRLIGITQAIAHTGPEFYVFVLLKK